MCFVAIESYSLHAYMNTLNCVNQYFKFFCISCKSSYFLISFNSQYWLMAGRGSALSKKPVGVFFLRLPTRGRSKSVNGRARDAVYAVLYMVCRGVLLFSKMTCLLFWKDTARTLVGQARWPSFWSEFRWFGMRSALPADWDCCSVNKTESAAPLPSADGHRHRGATGLLRATGDSFSMNAPQFMSGQQFNFLLNWTPVSAHLSISRMGPVA